MGFSMIVNVASLEKVFPPEFLATHRYFRSPVLVSLKTRSSEEILPFWIAISFTTVELFFNQLITGSGRPSAAHCRVTMATLLLR